MTDSKCAISFRSCKTIYGNTESLTVVKRGGRTILMLPPVWAEGGPMPTHSCPWLEDTRYYVNLNPIECRTWRRILSGASIRTIAAEEGVSRKAIYERIEGNRFGHGGMITKNFWCLLWWRLRTRQSAGPGEVRTEEANHEGNYLKQNHDLLF